LYIQGLESCGATLKATYFSQIYHDFGSPGAQLERPSRTRANLNMNESLSVVADKARRGISDGEDGTRRGEEEVEVAASTASTHTERTEFRGVMSRIAACTDPAKRAIILSGGERAT